MNEPLKQRVVGAVVLMLVAIIIVPWLLGDRREGSGAQSPAAGRPVPPAPVSAVTAPASGDFSSRIVPVERPSAGQRPAALPPAVAPVASPEPANPDVPAAAAADEASPPRPPRPPDPPPAPPREAPAVQAAGGPAGDAPRAGWSVQLGAFSRHDNALGLRQRLREQGHPAWVQRGADGISRVLVGPFDGREAALAAQPALAAIAGGRAVLREVRP